MAKKKDHKVFVPSFLKDAVNARLDDPSGNKAFPLLYALLAPVWEGKVLVYQPGKMTVRVEGASYVVVLDSPTAVLQTRIHAASLVGLVDAVEQVLSNGHVVWSPGWKKGGKQLPTVDDVIQ